MTSAGDPEGRLAAYLADGMDRLPDRVIDAVLDEASRTRQRTVFGPRRTPFMNSAMKVALAMAAVIVVAVAGINVLPGSSGFGAPGPGTASPAASSSPLVSPGNTATIETQTARLIVGGPDLPVDIDLPSGWHNNDYAAVPGSGQAGEVFFLSVPRFLFEDPCVHAVPEQEIVRTVDGVTAALRTIPGLTATNPAATSVAGYDAVYLELSPSGPLPCLPEQFYLWADSPQGFWWLLAQNEVIRVYILDVDGLPVTIAARSSPDATVEDKAALTQVLETMEFVEAS